MLRGILMKWSLVVLVAANILLALAAFYGVFGAFWVWQPGTRWNFARVTDQHLTDLFLQVTQDYVDEQTWIERWRAIALYCADQAYEIHLPSPNVYTLWQPWVKNYHGEYSLGRTDYRGYAPYIWIDQSLKK